MILPNGVVTGYDPERFLDEVAVRHGEAAAAGCELLMMEPAAQLAVLDQEIAHVDARLAELRAEMDEMVTEFPELKSMPRRARDDRL